MANPNSATTNPRQDDGSIYVMTLAQYNAAGGASAFPNQIINITDSGGVQYCNGSSLVALGTTSVFTASANGLAPLSGGGTTTFLRADGTWTTPPIQSMTLAQFNSAGGAAAFTNQIIRITDKGGLQFDDGTNLRSITQIIGQSNVNVCLQSSGTMGANGALTGLTAMPYAMTQGCWMYFPSGKVFSGSTAGFYWAVMSSTTAATVYNNMYTSGLPQDSIPASPTPVVDAGPGAYTQTTNTYMTAFSLTIPGLSNYGNAEFFCNQEFSYNLAAGNKSVTFKLNTSTFTTSTRTTSGGHDSFTNRFKCLNGSSKQSFYASSENSTSGGASHVITTENMASDSAYTLGITIDTATNYIILNSASLLYLPA
jgi:hypothetical protein